MVNKKKVTFADLLGFSLVSVVEISTASSFPDTRTSGKHKPQEKTDQACRQCYLKCLFEQPVNSDGFLERVQRQHVCLESVVCGKSTIRGFVRVLNVAYKKEVIVRYTTDGWTTFSQQRADYLSTSRGVTTDTFFFGISLPSDRQDTNKLEFAIRYRVDGNDYWDNNVLRNYCVCRVYKWRHDDLL